MIYLDSSALLKLVREEDETQALREWLAARPDEPVVTSELGRVEVVRAARRVGAEAATEAQAVLGEVDLVLLDRVVQDLACEVGAADLRTLDALHLASALVLGEDLQEFVAYDHRLVQAARASGLSVCVPGQIE
ncbi:MAG: type II toxin-antitoxin system VapC family toxin [Sporichthyaceae bacterium]